MPVHNTIPDILQANKNNFSISLEILPPIRGAGVNSIFTIIDEIEDLKPLWIDVTSHSSNIDWIPCNDNEMAYFRNKRRKSPGTIAICAAIKYKYNIESVPHILCGGFSREETEDALIDLDYMDIKNILAIRGDAHPPHLNNTLHGSNKVAQELLLQITNMNKGKFLDQPAEKTNFCVGVACYPEKHIEAANVVVSDNILYEKQRQGAKFAVCQMFFNNATFFDFIERTKQNITIPIIPALKIITSPKQLTTIPKHFYINIPQPLVESMLTANTSQEHEQIGLEWAFQQSVELIEKGHNHLHFYIMRDTKLVCKLIKRLHAHLSI